MAKQSVQSAKYKSVFEAGFVPSKEAVMGPAVLAQVFEGEAPPFVVRADGSVAKGVYMQWLEDAGQLALQAFGENSDVIENFQAVLS